MSEAAHILIEGNEWRAWNTLELRRSIDRFAQVTFEAPFEPERKTFRDTFQPFTFKPLNVLIKRETVFTGTLLGVEPDLEEDSRTVSCSGYSLPAVLQDCQMPASAFPLELNELPLSEIARRLLDPFLLTVLAEAPEGAAFDRVAIRPEETIYSFLSELAKQRNLIITDNGSGALRFLRSSDPGRPVAQFREGEAPLSGVKPRFSPQSYFSEITGIAKTRAGRGGSKYTEQNTHLTDELRPHTFQLDDTDDADAPDATRAKMGRMFGNMLSVELELPTWRDPRGQLFVPNTTVTLVAPGAMIYRETEFLIRDVIYRQDSEETSASLNLVLPGAFSGEIPKTLPWE